MTSNGLLRSRKMICEWGMSERIGPLNYARREEHIFLGKEMQRPRDCSEGTANDIDLELKALVTDCVERAKSLLLSNVDALHTIATTLLEKEVLDGQEIDAVILGKTNGLEETVQG